ncbi:Sodium/proline symporter 1 [Bienertia sinuspersici]
MSENAMDSFRAAIDQCSLKDLGLKGCTFTWQRGSDPATLIREQLEIIFSPVRGGVVSSQILKLVVANAWNESAGMNPATKIRVHATKLKSWANMTPYPSLGYNPEWQVSQLIDQDNGSLNVEVIQYTFIEEDRKKILVLPLSAHLPHDGCYWWPPKNGEYTAKSAYWLARNKAVHEPEVRTYIITDAGFINLVEDYVEYASSVQNLPHTSHISYLMVPSSYGLGQINTDANVLTGERASIGGVIREEMGALKAIGVKLVGPTSVEIAEAEAARYGLILSRRLGFLRIILECDAIGVVNAINSKK